jgi:outer membrane protein
MKRRVLIGLVGCLLSLGVWGSVFAADGTVGYVDLQRVKETEEWKRLKSIFEADLNKSRQEIEQKRKGLETAVGQYEKQKPMLSESARRDREKELQKQQLDLQQLGQDRQKVLEKKEDEMTEQIWATVNGVVEKIAKQKHLLMVIDYRTDPGSARTKAEKGVLYMDPSLDLTNEVLKEYNALPKGKK